MRLVTPLYGWLYLLNGALLFSVGADLDLALAAKRRSPSAPSPW